MVQPGTIFDNKYQIEAAIGQGGFGYVYRARERLTGETVAIKELVPAFVDGPERYSASSRRSGPPCV